MFTHLFVNVMEASFATPVAWYDAQLRALPLFTKTWTAVVLFAAGDVANQRWTYLAAAPRSRGAFAHDRRRTARMAAWAAVATAPNALWYPCRRRR